MREVQKELTKKSEPDGCRLIEPLPVFALSLAFLFPVFFLPAVETIKTLVPDLSAGCWNNEPRVGIRPALPGVKRRVFADGWRLDTDLLFLWTRTTNVYLSHREHVSDAVTISGARISLGHPRMADIFWFGLDARNITFWKTTEYSDHELRTEARIRFRSRDWQLDMLNRYGRLVFREGIESQRYVEPRGIEHFKFSAGTSPTNSWAADLAGDMRVSDYLDEGLDYMDHSDLKFHARAGYRPGKGISFGIGCGARNWTFREGVRNDFNSVFYGGWVERRGIPGRRVVGAKLEIFSEHVEVDNGASSAVGDDDEAIMLSGSLLLELVLGDAVIMEMYGNSSPAVSREANFTNLTDYGVRVRWLLKKRTRCWLVGEYGGTSNDPSIRGMKTTQWHTGADMYWTTGDGWAWQLGWRETGRQCFERQRNYRESQMRVGLRFSL